MWFSIRAKFAMQCGSTLPFPTRTWWRGEKELVTLVDSWGCLLALAILQSAKVDGEATGRSLHTGAPMEKWTGRATVTDSKREEIDKQGRQWRRRQHRRGITQWEQRSIETREKKHNSETYEKSGGSWLDETEDKGNQNNWHFIWALSWIWGLAARHFRVWGRPCKESSPNEKNLSNPSLFCSFVVFPFPLGPKSTVCFLDFWLK